MLTDSDHFSVRLHLSLSVPKQRKMATMRQKRNGKNFESKYGTTLPKKDIQSITALIAKDYRSRVQNHRAMHAHLSAPLTVQDEHGCLLASIGATFDDLPKKLRRKTGWYEGNEKELDELIAARNAANRKYASSKTVNDHETLKVEKTERLFAIKMNF